MADFVAVLRRAIDSLETNTPDTRAALYDKARAALLAQLRGMEPPLADDELAQQAEALDLAIARLEEEYAADDEPGDAPAVVGATPPVDEAESDEQDEPEASGVAEEDPATATRGVALPGAAAAVAAGTARGAGAPGPQPAITATPEARPRKPSQPSQAAEPARSAAGTSSAGSAERVRDGRYAGEEAAARSRAAASAYEAEAAAAPPPRRRRLAIWTGAAILVLLLAVAGLWQSDLIFSTADRTLEQIAAGDTKIDEQVPGQEAAPAADATSEYQGTEGQEPADAAEPAAPEAATEPETATEGEPADAVPSAEQEQATLTDQPTPPGASAQAILIEEATGGPGSANTLGGSVQWEIVEENETQGPAQAISGTVTIPDRNLDAVITIRRNADADLPASHTVEIIFEANGDFGGGGISNVPGIIMKATPRSTGQPLVGAVVPVTENFFLVGLSEGELDRQRNVSELRGRDFIDIPLVYENGGRAVLSIAKGEEGQQVFNQAFDAWQQ